MTKEERINNLQSLLVEEQNKVADLRTLLNEKSEAVKSLDQECRQLQGEIIKGNIRVELRMEDLEKEKNG